ncbi:MAG: Uma2 family endonuclease [Armatimonadetes bacterium]|nr:Uma2 family endonuclease [Armatimonadota bacterium]
MATELLSGKVAVSATINGEPTDWLCEPRETLLEVLRGRLGLTGSKEGCGNGNCGACAVMMDGRLVNACCVLGVEAQESEITTVEGIGGPEGLTPLQRCFLEEASLQCGFCTPGFLVAATALLDRNPDPSEEEIRWWLAGNLCRCTGYDKILLAVQRAAAEIRGINMQSVVSPQEITQVMESRTLRLGERPIPFERYLELTGENDDIELVNGVMVENMATQYDHERLFGWFYLLLGSYVGRRGLGVVLGSRTAVRINEFGGRLPDLLFVRRERLDIIQQKAITGAPDLVIEIVSPNDRPSDIIGLETDYRSIGVAEIAFIDRGKGRVRLLRKRGETYEEEEVRSGPFRFETVEGFRLEAEGVLNDALPDEFAILDGLLAQGKSAQP